MHTHLRFIFRITSLLILFFICTSYSPRTRMVYTPIYMERSELEQSVRFIPEGRPLIQPGKIYYKKPYIYINEKYKGIHIINNSDPSNPLQEGFISVPGCIDIAVKEDILYADNSVDLVAFSLSTRKTTQRIKEVFPEPESPEGEYYYEYGRPDGLILVEWRKTYIKE